MNAHEILARRRAQFENPDAVDAAALATIATKRYIIMGDFSSIIGYLAGAPQAASTARGFYSPYLDQLWNPNGSPAAQQFIGQTKAGLQPEFDDQNKALLAELNATGIAHSGAAKANLQDLVGRQSAALAGATAPFYGQALGEYGNLAGQSAGAQEGAYTNSLNQFYNFLEAAGSAAAGVPNIGAPGAGGVEVGPNDITPSSGSPYYVDWSQQPVAGVPQSGGVSVPAGPYG